jgi:hypothetical protein
MEQALIHTFYNIINYVTDNKIELKDDIFLEYFNDEETRNLLNERTKTQHLELCLDLSKQDKYMDTNILFNITTLNLQQNNRIKYIGNMKNLRNITIGECVDDFYLLPSLEKVTFKIHGKILKKKTLQKINKLKKKIPNVKIEIIEIVTPVRVYNVPFYNSMIYGLGEMKYSN